MKYSDNFIELIDDKGNNIIVNKEHIVFIRSREDRSCVVATKGVGNFIVTDTYESIINIIKYGNRFKKREA